MKAYYEYVPEDDEFPCVIICVSEKQGDFDIVGSFPTWEAANEWGKRSLQEDHWYIKGIRPIMEYDHKEVK